jgi:hypothetical protein
LEKKKKIMETNQTPSSEKVYGCETCPMRKKGEEKPKSLMGRLWRWHTSWCPGWKEYQAHLAEQTN